MPGDFIAHTDAPTLIAQGVGLAAFVIAIVALSSKDDTRLKWLLALAAATIALHFTLLGAYVAACVMALNSSRFVLANYSGTKGFAFLYIAAYIGFGAWNYQAPVDLLPVASGMIGTLAVFCFSGIRMRALLLTCSVLWLTHNSIQGSLGGILMEIAFIAASALAIQKMRLLRTGL
jgi:hypothetical protein